MKKTMGILLMIFGAVSLVAGLMVYKQEKKELDGGLSEQVLTKTIESAAADGILTKNEREIIANTAIDLGRNPDEALKMAEELTAQNAPNAEAEIIDFNQKNGRDFEDFVVKKFNRDFFTVIEWTGDKYVDGIYAAGNQNPDVILEFKLKDVRQRFAVECKFKSNFYKGGVEFASQHQFERYKTFENENSMPVFIVIGIGGSGANPERLFIHPLRFLNSNFLPLKTLERGEKKNLDKNFFFDGARNVLN